MNFFKANETNHNIWQIFPWRTPEWFCKCPGPGTDTTLAKNVACHPMYTLQNISDRETTFHSDVNYVRKQLQCMSDNVYQRVLEIRSERKKKTNDTERKTYEAETQETTFKRSKLTGIFEHSLNSGTGHRVLAASMWKTWNSFLGAIMSSTAPQSFPSRYWGKKASLAVLEEVWTRVFPFPFHTVQH